MDTEVHEVEQYVEARPEIVYGLVSNVERMGEWSPETVRATWVDGSTGPVVGAKFKAWNRRGFMRWSNTPVVIVADEGSEFAFDRRSAGQSVVWRFTMEPSGTGTRLRQSYQLDKTAPPLVERLVAFSMRTKDRHAQLDEDMRVTLSRIAKSAESAQHSP